MAVSSQKLLSSLPLQILLYFNIWFSCLYIFFSILFFIYKGHELPYPSGTIGWEVFFVIVVFFTDLLRIFQGIFGNKTEQTKPLLFFIILSVFVIFGNVYFLDQQVYVLHLDVILNSLSLSFVGLEILFAILAWVRFIRSNPFG
eukprot:GCRY01003354.1.p1 GENE.GCRY01003354.1~~GCRY01003354.1.p1  ORF type:complete len:144 (-),score=19.92 GCRY01003354.1:203-634(-)